MGLVLSLCNDCDLNMATGTKVSFVCTLLAWLLSTFTVKAEDNCSYITYAYNQYDARNEQMVSYKTCQWGCCWQFSDPCCTPPVGLIVGCVIGGFLCLVILVGVICCCCYCCCRQVDTPDARGAMVVRYPHHSGDGTVHISSTNASSSGMDESETAISTSLPPGVYQPPPSYEEVMGGEINSIFKPESESETPPE